MTNERLLEIVTEQLLLQQENCQILEIFKTGSRLFKDNGNDIDYIIVLDGYEQRRKKVILQEGNETLDLVFIDNKAAKKQLSFEDSSYIQYKTKLYNYFYMIKDTIHGQSDQSWNMLDFEAEYKTYIKDYYNVQIGSATDKLRFGKQIVHYYLILRFYENQGFDIDEEMLANVNYLYDKAEEALPVIEWVEAELAKI